MFDPRRYMAVDFETSGTLPEYALQPWRIQTGHTWATSLVTVRRAPDGTAQVGGGLCVGPTGQPAPDLIRAMLDEAIRDNLTLVAWNAPFDISVMLAYGFDDLVFKCKFLDAMLLWKHLTVTPEYDLDRSKKKSYSLKPAVAEYIPQWAGYEEDVDFHTTDPESLAKLHTYNIQDTAATLHLARKFYLALEADPQRLNAALIEAKCLPLVAWANLHGIPMSALALNLLDKALVEEAAEALAVLAPHGVTEAIVRSPKQLSDLMFRQWGLPVIKQNTSKKTGNTTDSTDKEALHELAFIDPRAKYLRAYREALGNKTKFVDAPLTSVEYNGDGRSHPLANVFGTYTGRMSYSSKQGKNKDARQIGFALHQEKREARFRDIAVPPEGYTLVEFDAAGQEYRWMAVASGDEAMQQLCMDGEDPHSYMGAQIAREQYEALKAAIKRGESEAKPKRQLGKVANLSCIAEGSLILTNRGLVPIEAVQRADLLWDGATWVKHEGVIFKGREQVITYAGLAATADHMVLKRGAHDTWITFDQAERQQWQIERGIRPKWKIVFGILANTLARTICPLPISRISDVVTKRYAAIRRPILSRVVHSPPESAKDRWRRALRSVVQVIKWRYVEPSAPQRNTTLTHRVYDILNCGPQNRFVANGLVVHNCGYRTSAAKLRVVARVQYNLPMELPEATHIRATYLRTYPGVPRYWDAQISKVRRLGYAETFAGRRVQVQGQWAGTTKWSLESTAINYPIQGTGADQKYLALAVLRPYIVRHNIHFAWELHDGLYFYVPNKIVQQSIADMKYLLDNIPYAKAWGFQPPVPMPWDCKVGPSWGQLKEVKV